jgi:aspartyl-tRNA(Asn)/glutamyl-tRNA(Gln) amidotransferase subunit A
VAELSEALSTRQLSPVDLVAVLLDRIERRNPTLHAVIEVYAAAARLAAEAVDKAIRAGHRVGPRPGIPLALQETVALEGRVTTAGSQAWATRVSPVTATLAQRLIAAGMIVLGKTHTVEFSYGWGINPHLGTPRPPWDLAVHRTPGGSSSGSAVAVAAGLVPAAIGAATAGSIRTPAAWGGIVGLKVPVGRISTPGVVPRSTTLDTPGPMVRSVEDAALRDRVLNGPDPRDRHTHAFAAADPLPPLRRGVAGLRLAVVPEAERTGVDPQVLAAYDAAVEVLSRLGARMVTIDWPHRCADYRAGRAGIMGAASYRYLGPLVDDPHVPIAPYVRARIQVGRDVSTSGTLRALAPRDECREAFAAATAGVDAVLTPTTQTPAIPLDHVGQGPPRNHFARVGNYLGRCALAVPNGFTAGGLPTALQILCSGGSEAMALRIGWAYEQATAWQERRPPEGDVLSEEQPGGPASH